MIGIRILGAATFFVALSTITPTTAFAADPVQPQGAAWIQIVVPENYTPKVPGTSVPGLDFPNSWNALSNIHFNETKTVNGNVTATVVDSITVERPRGQYEYMFPVKAAQQLMFVRIVIREPAANGQATWYEVDMAAPIVAQDITMTKNGQNTEELTLNFGKNLPGGMYRVQTAQSYGTWNGLPAQWDKVKNFYFPIAAARAVPAGAAKVNPAPVTR